MDKKKTVILCSIILLVVATFVVIVSIKNNNKIFYSWHSNEITKLKETENANYSSAEGKYSVSVTTVYETAPDTDEASPPEAEKVVVVVYEYTNEDIEKGLVIGNSHFKAYDKDGNELKVYPQKNLFEPGEIGETGTHTASVAFAFNNDENYIKICYFNDISAEIPDFYYEKTW